MPPRNAIFTLPPELRDQLNAKLVQSGFGDYTGLSAWLQEQGWEISKSAVHRYGQALASEYEAAMADVKKATELARAYAADDADDGAALTGAIARMAQESLLRILLALRKAEQAGEHEPQEMAKHMSQVSRALADLGRVTISHAKHASAIRAQLAQELEQRVQQAGAGGAISPEQLRKIISEAYGVAG